MNLKLIIALLSVGILCLVGATAVVASLPSTATSSKTTQAAAKTVSVKTPSTQVPNKPAALPTSTTRPTSSTTVPPTLPPATTHATTPTTSAVPPSTAFVLTTLTYEVKAGDTVATIQSWFDSHGYAVQFAANLQVLEDNEDLLVPGALISLSNGVMTIHSPL